MKRTKVTTKPLGVLETQLMELVWASEVITVRKATDLLKNKLAYTTVMTTLDRLYRKGLVKREKISYAFQYRAAIERQAFQRHLVERAVADLLQSSPHALAAFVDAAAAVDEDNLARLDKLIASKRKGR